MVSLWENRLEIFEIGLIVICMVIVDEIVFGCGIIIYIMFVIDVFNDWKLVFSFFMVELLLEICCIRVDNVNMCMGFGIEFVVVDNFVVDICVKLFDGLVSGWVKFWFLDFGCVGWVKRWFFFVFIS